MTIRALIHVHQDEEANIFEYANEDGKYIVLHIGEASIFINDREKALELASLLERAAQEWGGEV